MINRFTLDEKITLLTGENGMASAEFKNYGIKARFFADGPHGIRESDGKNSVHFPSITCISSSWDKEMIYKMGEALAGECINQGIALILAPGINIKRYILCGRNFEYMSEDPILAGEMAAGYINGVQSKGIGTSLKHFALNSQEEDRLNVNVEIDERTMREIYLKAFEIAVKKSQPESVMCAYNKVNAIWCSENKYLLNDILKKEWEYKGFVVSDWGAVHDACRAVEAGIDLIMPREHQIVEKMKEGLKNGYISEERIDEAARKVFDFITRERPEKDDSYDRDKQHKIARELAASGIVLLKNEGDVLPLTKEKYHKIAVIGGYGKNPLVNGQGSCEVYQEPEYTDNPLEEIERLMPDTQITYKEVFNKVYNAETMAWTDWTINEFAKESDVVVFFVGNMAGEDTEQFDRTSAKLRPVFAYFINNIKKLGKKVVVVLQTGSAVIINDWLDSADAVIEMWYGGEAAGGAIADVLCGIVNPSGKLAETFPNKMRKDMEYHGDLKVSYDEKLDVGYRYYDKHTDEICYPFGHGLSYTKFEYSNCDVKIENEEIKISFDLENIGKCDGQEVVQVYVSDPESTVTKPIKELKSFEKVYLQKGEKKKIEISIPCSELAYYNTMLHNWVIENGEYKILVASSSQDIRLSKSVIYDTRMPYSMTVTGKTMVG